MKRTGDRRENRMVKDLVFSIPLPYGLLYVRDSESLDDPEIDGRATFWRTDTVLAVGGQGDMDGSTEIRLNGMPKPGEDLSLLTAFDTTSSTRCAWGGRWRMSRCGRPECPIPRSSG